ncbi:MFS multidrug transporter, partial [Pseudohyphozyma bogoriensis]
MITPFMIPAVDASGITSDPKKVGYFVGMLDTVFAMSSFVTVVAWGRLSDRWGRKPVLMIGLVGIAVATVGFGFSRTFAALVVVRAFGGGSNANTPVVKSMIGEITDETNQALAFAFIPISWSVGAIIGPMIGGYSSYPASRFPRLFGHIQLLHTYPYALPCLIGAVAPLCGALLGSALLEESRPQQASLSDVSKNATAGRRASYTTGTASTITLAPLPEQQDEERSQTAVKPPPMSAMWTKRVVVAFTVFTLLSLQTMSMDAVLILFASTKVSLGGLGFTPSELGLALSGLGATKVFTQFFIFPPLQRRLGTRALYRTLMGTFPFICCLYPVLGWLAKEDVGLPEGTEKRRVWAVLGLLIASSAVANTAYACNLLTTTSAAPSKQLLGSINGVAAMLSALMRSIGP